MGKASRVNGKKRSSDPGKCVMAVAAHPDDIEFAMTGTLLALQKAGWEVHYLNIANGCGGSLHLGPREIARKRLAEARASCALAGFRHHPPLTNDLEIAHVPAQLAGVVSAIRAARPSIVLTQSPQDYMEDHQNAARLAVTAAFCKNVPNAPCKPARPAFPDDIAVYHAMPHGLRDSLGKRLRSGLWVDVSAHIEMKKNLLACHESQNDWLDATQGMNSSLQTMVALCLAMGKLSGKFALAEGWRRHNPLGYSADPNFDPLRDALGKLALVDKKYAKWLEE